MIRVKGQERTGGRSILKKFGSSRKQTNENEIEIDGNANDYYRLK